MSQVTKTQQQPWQRAVRDIAGGKCDDHLVEIAQALQHRVIDATIVTQWHLQLDGLDIFEGDLTLDEWERWTTLADSGTWHTLKPLQSARTARTLVQTLAESRLGLEAEEAELRAKGYSGASILGCFSEEQVPDPFARPSGQSA